MTQVYYRTQERQSRDNPVNALRAPGLRRSCAAGDDAWICQDPGFREQVRAIITEMSLTSHNPGWFGWLLPAVPLLLFLLLQLTGSDLWFYRREAVLEGEWWRLLSAHFAHLGWPHLLLNSVGVVIAWRLFEPWWRPAIWFAALLWCSLATALALLWLSPELAWYGGFSGVLHGMFVFGAAMALIEDHDGLAGFVLLLLAAKVLWEQWFGGSDALTAQLIGAAVVVDAHFYGALAGLLPVPFIHRR